MNAFAANWLALREPLDHASRNRVVFEAVQAFLSGMENARVLDLAGGTGSTIRAFHQSGLSELNWIVVDNDPDLLKHAQRQTPIKNVEFVCRDISSIKDVVNELKPDLIATSAFLDLVSANWMIDLGDALSELSTPFYAALTYNGKVSFSPQLELDATIVDLVNEHQLGDKGFGPALGPGAVRELENVLKDRNFNVVSGLSDWNIGRGHEELHDELLTGWVGAAGQLQNENSPSFDQWLNRRKLISDSSSGEDWKISVGHCDVFAHQN